MFSKCLYNILALIITLFLFSQAASNEPIYETDDVIVTATRIPTSFADVNRDITILTTADIEKLPVSSVQDLFDYVSSVNLKTRGRQGVQADLSIRGSTFEQVLVLIDGVKISDPQTGHHNLDIPLDLQDIKQIEILKGGGSSHYGPGAFGGVVNIITRHQNSRSFQVRLSGGDFEYADASAAMSYPMGNTENSLSILRQRSGGFTQATDFNTTQFRYSSGVQFGSYKTSLSIGYVDKEFGANRFYSDNFPNEWENTKTTLIDAGITRSSNSSAVSFKLNWRRHNDDFILDTDYPDSYHNKHTTDSYGAEVEAQYYSPLGRTALGGEIGNEEIRSASLGNHARLRGGIFLGHQFMLFDRLTSQLDGFIYKHENYDWNIWPSLSVGYKLTSDSKLYGSISKSYRAPTFTDLYYVSPANIGNPELVPEQALCYEIGYSFYSMYVDGGISLFRREGDNLIDWFRQSPDDLWQVQNVSDINTNGLEISVVSHPDLLISNIPISTISASYTMLDADRDCNGFESKYALDLLEHQLLISIVHSMPFNMNQVWKFRYEVPSEDDSRMITDTKLIMQFNKLEWYLEASNIFDYTYNDIGSIPMPGRQVITGVSYQVF